jgi:hypothetical protein
MPAKLLKLSIFCAWLALGPGLCLGQDPAQTTLSQAASMPGWIVPVLRLVSATHVEPTTGVVISNTGLVLLADDFASSGDEIVVLDGGTDIIRNGRPAKIERQFPAQGLMVLSVNSLNRNAAQFTPGDLADGDSIHLQAFPPAKMIEQGAPPLDVSATVNVLPDNNIPVLSGGTPLPNVTGPIIDDCGNLSGYSSADGVQSMSTSESPRYHWKDSLLTILNELQIEIIENPCDLQPPPADAETAVDTPVEPELEPADESEKPDEEPGDDEAVKDEAVAEEESLSELDILPPIEIPADSSETDLPEESTAEPGDKDEENGISAWIWLLTSILLLGSAIVLHRFRNSRVLSTEEEARASQVPSPPLQDNEDGSEYLAPGLDSLLIIEGMLSDGTEFSQSSKVSRNAINIVIGRGNADINIDSNAVSRQHVCLNGTREMLTITDLGANNGTTINGIPCLEGETMFIVPDDIIILGNARFRYSIVAVEDA